MPSKVAFMVAPLMAGALLVQYAQVGRVTVGEIASTTALILVLLGGG